MEVLQGYLKEVYSNTNSCDCNSTKTCKDVSNKILYPKIQQYFTKKLLLQNIILKKYFGQKITTLQN